MAQGKVTNRQKMINMMYLVLLAILVLNVSAEALDAFARIRQELKKTASDVNISSADFIRRMKEEINREVEKEGKDKNAGLLDTLDQIRTRTLAITRMLDRHNQEMESIADFDPEKNDFKKKDEQEKNYRYWMGDEEANDRRGNGAAYSLRDSLDAYFSFVSSMYNSQVKVDSMKKEAHKLADPAESSEDENKRWEQYTFEGPVIGNMASLEALKIDVLREEKKLLELLNTRLGGHIFIPDKAIAISAPVSKIVPAGLQFQTKLFVGMVSSQVRPQFSSSNGNISVEEGGNSAILSIPASGNVIRNGEKEGRQTFSATIKVPTATGEFQELTVSEDFIVRKPEVVITSTVVQNLYRDCGNTVTIDVPALGDLYDPVVNASNADIRQSDQARKRFLIDPNGRETVVTVNSRTNGQMFKIDAIKYNVIEPPRPSLDLKVNNRPYSLNTTINRGSRMTLKLIPDREFARLLNDDARYQIDKIEILVKPGLEPPRVVKTIRTDGQDARQEIAVSLGNALNNARVGDKFYIRVNEVYRINYRGKKIADKRISEIEKTFPLILGR